MADKVQIRRDTAANWTTANPVLAQGELGYELDTCQIKIGDGITDWNNLDYKFSDDQDASEVIVTPSGNLTSTDVQAALEELQTEIDSVSGSAITDHTQLSNIGTNTHAQIDSHISDTNNPHNVTASQVGLGNVDNTSDADKPISTAQQTALDLKYDASNPANYIDSAGAPVQPSDIADFETTTQLNARDTANRDRSNHTGTQLASTISDFVSAVQTNETTTNLTLVANQLSYTNEDGVTQSFDLSVYLDDTNAARIVNGTVDGNTGIATFTRDDSTTFTVDFSALFDDTNLARIVSGTVSGTDIILTRSDSTTVTIDASNFSPDLSNYYTKTELDSGQLNNIYYTETEINSLQSIQDTAITNNQNNITTNSNNITTNSNSINTNSTNITNNTNNIAQEITDRTNADSAQQLLIDQNTTDNNGSVDVHNDVNLDGNEIDLQGGSSGDVIVLNNGVAIPQSIDFGFTLFGAEFEENGTIANNQYEWSIGNGAAGPRIGYIVPENCELYRMAINVDSATVGTSASINIRRAAANTADVNNSPIIVTPTFTGNNQIQNFTPIQLTEGDVLIPQTNTVIGTWNDVRIYLYFRRIATSTAAKTIIKSVGVQAVAFNSTTFVDIPGLSSTVTLTRPGTLIGDLIYSASRSGAANAVTEFRVTVNGDNGQSYNDTLSTFNDTGAATHFLDNVPAGTYTISAQALTDQPITIASAGLKLTAKED